MLGQLILLKLPKVWKKCLRLGKPPKVRQLPKVREQPKMGKFVPKNLGLRLGLTRPNLLPKPN